MNSRALQLAISTLILFVLGILVLIGLAYTLTDGFKKFKSSSDPFLDTTQSSSIKQACILACQNQDKIAFCDNEYTLNEETINCSDERLEINCQTISCEA